jgi:hypothetical protein
MTTLEEGRQLLGRCRHDSAAWEEAACTEAPGDDAGWTDRAARRRYVLLLALQYDLRTEDRALVRFLFEQETLRHRREPFQGLDPALPLAGYLLATFRAVEHVWLFAEAKRANFDTYLGFDRAYLVSAGTEATLAYVRAADIHPLRQDVLDWLVGADGQYVVTEDELLSWWRQMAADYPSQLADEDPLARLNQALELDDREEARRWLITWEATLPRTSRQLRTIAWYWAQLHDWDRAGAVVAELLAHDDVSTWDRASLQTDAAAYHRQAGRAVEAGQQLLAARRTLADIGAWWRYGLGRSAIEEALRIAQALPSGHEQAEDAYRWAGEQLQRKGVATLLLLQLAETAAAHLGDTKEQTRYNQRAKRERQRIDQMIKRPV